MACIHDEYVLGSRGASTAWGVGPTTPSPPCLHYRRRSHRRATPLNICCTTRVQKSLKCLLWSLTIEDAVEELVDRL